MSKKEYHSSIRITESEKSFLESHHISVLSVLRIGFASLKLVAQSGDPTACVYYVINTVANSAPPADPMHQGLDPAAHCCPSCPVRKAMPKRIPAALQPGQKEIADMIEQDQSSSCR